MKTLQFLLIIFITTNCCFLSAQIHVKHDANGANNGTSWNDAYTDLQMAFDNSKKGDQVWIAAGTYKPTITGDTADAYFRFPHDLKVYGGFDGTETALEQRDWLTNQSILSGDHLGDDIDDDFDNNRVDNSRHVMWLTDTVTNATIIDGLTFRNGNTEPQSGSGNDRRGGGLLTLGAPIIRNCYFTQNYGYFGGGLYPRGAAATGVQILDCTFENNEGGSGAAFYINSDTATVGRCHFANNHVLNSGGAIYNGVDDDMHIFDCTFSSNSTSDFRGGAVYNTFSPTLIERCTFDRNRAPNSSGGAVQIRNSDDTDPIRTVVIRDCEFTNNDARWGGAVGTYDRRSISIIDNCSFSGNFGSSSGGAGTNAFGATSNYVNCTFESNTSPIGGALYSQNDSSVVNVTACIFSSNIADERGGAINISGDDEPAAMLPLPILTIVNSEFQGNSSKEQAGAINIGNANLQLTSSVLTYNFTENLDGVGGALSLNCNDSLDCEYRILNSTLSLNTAFVGAGISSWKQTENGTAVLYLQNTILENPDGANYEIEDGTPTVMSDGGNLCGDISLEDELSNTNDVSNIAPGFVDPAFNFRLRDDSPAVNTGIDDNAPDTDFEGNPRLGITDKGAFENQNVSAIKTPQQNAFGSMEVFPNPVVDFAHVSINNNYYGNVFIRVLNMNGRLVQQYRVQKDSPLNTFTINMSTVSSGQYLIESTNGIFSSTITIQIN